MEETSARSRVAGRQIALIAGGLVLVLIVLWFFVLRGGGPGTEDTSAAPVPAAPAPTPDPTPPPGRKPEAKGGGGVKTFQVFAPRDPFDPLISASAAASAGATAVTPSSGTTVGPTGGSPGGTGGSTGGSSVGGHRVRVVDVYRAKAKSRAQVEVDGTVYTAGVGESFADGFELVSTSGKCAALRYGKDRFTLCEGEEILK